VDSTPAPIDVLPSVSDAVGSRLTVLVDSGFRRGADVVKGLALGAKAVLIGRAPLFGTAIAGEAGAARAIEIYRDEIDRMLALIGCPDISALGRDYVVPASQHRPA
jgi:isopentenyl diphosphate isomerase/L-lactate dehydrogenase-like FMN-dependent dehydrogenase